MKISTIIITVAVAIVICISALFSLSLFSSRPMPVPVMMPAPAPAPSEKIIQRPDAYVKKKTAPKSVNKSQIADNIVSQLVPANMVFTVDPKHTNISEQISVSMLIDMTKTLDELRMLTKESDYIHSSQIRVSKVVIAKVIAPDFNVIAITPEEQPISETEITKWQWELLPLKTGKHEIHVTVNAEVNVDGVSKTRNIETFRETVEIEITLWQLIKSWAAQYWQWAFSTLILPLAIWFWKSRRSKRSEEIKKPSQ